MFHNTAQVGSAWCCAEGIVTTLAALNYEVYNCGHPQSSAVPIELLRKMDLIILGAPEWFGEVLAARYGSSWAALPATKIAWYAESAHRDDRTFDFARCRPLADLHYFPAMQDADEFDGKWLPFAADTTIFRPLPVEKQFQAAFLGTLYPKRADYIRDVGFPISILAPVHADHPVASFNLLAHAYNSTEIFVNMPAYSRLLVTKVTEVMACRTMLITPALDHPSGFGNMKQFEDGTHLVYYNQDKPAELSALLDYYRHHPEERDQIAQAGCEEISTRHSLAHRVQQMVREASCLMASS